VTVQGARPGSLELGIARLLTAGTYVSVALVSIGLVGMLVSGISPLAASPTLDVARIPADLLAGRPEAFLWLGVIVAIATPPARVAAALVRFVRDREWPMAAVAGAILLVITLSVIVARLSGR
jgi:uncharacterized membrane protein